MLSKSCKVGWIGTGVMGKAMAGHLMNGGFNNMYVFNRTASKADDLVKMGAKFMESPRHVAAEVDVLFLMLGYPHDVKAMIWDEDKGILNHMKKDSFIVDHTTSSPGLAEEMAFALASKGVHSVDAPVSGGDTGAKNGALVTMVGGHKESVDEVRPLLDIYSQNVQLMGGPGAGQHTKAANQIMIASSMVGTCEGLLYAHKAGLKLDQMIDLLKAGGAGSFTLANLGPRMLKRDFAPGFYVEHFIKDLGIVLEESKRLNLNLPGTKLATELYKKMAEQGNERDGTAGLLKTLEGMNNT